MRQLKITKQVTNRESASLDKYLQEIARISLLEGDEEVDLAIKIKKGDRRALERLIKTNLRFVVSVAKQYQNQGLSLPDLINEGNVGLIKAAQRFDETKGFKFISYAVWWIRQSILQALAEQSRMVRLPLNKIGALSKINQTYSKLLYEFQREPSAEEIAKELDLLPDEVRSALLNSSHHASIDAPIGDDEDSCVVDFMQNSESTIPDKTLMNDSLKIEIKRMLSTLGEREADIVRLYFGIDEPHSFTLEEIGERFGLTRERVRQIKSKTIKALKQRSCLIKQYL
ncbi:MAG: RNA polymerase sigma factor RpoD/SigA [Bacteroidales bacterium]|nr:RNA polymerase sigma factor RpoD/SigA [Bacteroidales bacterium]